MNHSAAVYNYNGEPTKGQARGPRFDWSNLREGRWRPRVAEVSGALPP